jgi:hypothetical protein
MGCADLACAWKAGRSYLGATIRLRRSARPAADPSKPAVPDKIPEERQITYLLTLIDGAALQSMDPTLGVPGENDLLDARNLMEGGDYSGAVLDKLETSMTDFLGRLRQWKRLSGVQLPPQREETIKKTRKLRHEIVLRGRRIVFRSWDGAQMRRYWLPDFNCITRDSIAR